MFVLACRFVFSLLLGGIFLHGCAIGPNDEAAAAETADAATRGVFAVSASANSSSSDLAEREFLESLLFSLSLEQKVAQLIQPDIRYVTPEEVRRYGIGSVLNGGGAFPGMNKRASLHDWLTLADDYYFASTDTSAGSAGIPLLWGTDAVHGHNNVYGATIFPHNIGLGATRNAALVEAIAKATALEVRASGIDWIFAPTLAVATDLRWGRTYESFSSDPQLVADMGAAAIRGIQNGGAIATAKHFIGDGATHEGIDQGDARLSKSILIDVHGAGYRAAIGANVQTVMASFNSWNGAKVHGHRGLLQELLREEMGFKGTVVSDWNGLGQVRFCSNTDCPQAFNAGIDIAMVPTQWKDLLRNTLAQVESGEISLPRLNEAVMRVLSLKYRAGLFAGESPTQRAASAKLSASVVGNDTHRALAAQAVRESLVLLKLENGALPLDDAARILVTGSAADSLQMQTGGWSLTWQGSGNSNADFPGGSTVFDGIAKYTAAGGGSVELSRDERFEHRPDIAVVVFGESPYAEGQGDVDHLNHSARYPKDLEIMQRLQEQGIPVVSVFVSGRPAWINKELNASDALVVAWLPGSQGGAIADVLFADLGSDKTFRGRLPMAWPASDVNLLDVELPVDEHLFPFGYGLALDDRSVDVVYSEVSYAPERVEEALVFSRRSQPPWILMLGDAYNWELRVEASSVSSQGGRIQVEAFDRHLQQDARRIIWDSQPGKYAQVFWRHTGGELVDFSAALEQKALLALQIRVDAPPSGRVLARVDCIYPCAGELDITEAIRERVQPARRSAAVPETAEAWFELLIPMQCFARAGARLSSVSSPLVLLADGKFSVSVSDVRIRPPRGGDKVLDCTERSYSSTP